MADQVRRLLRARRQLAQKFNREPSPAELALCQPFLQDELRLVQPVVVLAIGGVREKVLAAQRAGLGRVILPRENEPDLEELPPETHAALRFVLVDSIAEVFDAAFSTIGSATNGRVRPTSTQG